jgi:mRNA interferase HigB
LIIPIRDECHIYFIPEWDIIQMRVISRKKLVAFWKIHEDAEDHLKSWFYEAEHATWKSFEDIKRHYSSADPIAGKRVIFNIKGNKYRLIVKIHYNKGVVFIRFVGTHEEYNKIIAEKI